MTGPPEPVTVYTAGLCAASVCYDASLPLEEVTRRVNHAVPTGISSAWAPSDAETFHEGVPNPCECNVDPGRLHRLYVC